MIRTSSPVLLTTIMCLAHVGILIDAFTFATLIKTFEAEWLLSKAEQGWVAGIYLAAYVPAVPVLMALTDRMDARWIFMTGCMVIGIAAAGFALFAEGFWSAMVFRALSGLGFAAAYMPGLRVLVDRFEAIWESRAIAFYTASWSLGTAVSYLLAGAIGDAYGWRTAFLTGAGGAVFGFLLVALLLRPTAPHALPNAGRLLDFRPVLRNRPAVGYMIGYAAHSWELFGLRTWLVAFLMFCLSQQPDPTTGWFTEPSRIATLSAIVAMASSVLGNELASHKNRERVIITIQLISGTMACVIGFLGTELYLIVAALTIIYALLVQADSGSLTAGLVSVAEPGRRGATLAMYQVIGWIGGFLGPVLVGIILGTFAAESKAAWGFAFITMGGVGFIGAAAMKIFSGPLKS